MKSKPTYTPDFCLDVFGEHNALMTALGLVDKSIFFAMEPMPDDVFRFYVKEEASETLKNTVAIMRPRPKNVRCYLCKEEAPEATAHRHQGRWIGDCCWDERLRTTQ